MDKDTLSAYGWIIIVIIIISILLLATPEFKNIFEGGLAQTNKVKVVTSKAINKQNEDVLKDTDISILNYTDCGSEFYLTVGVDNQRTTKARQGQVVSLWANGNSGEEYAGAYLIYTDINGDKIKKFFTPRVSSFIMPYTGSTNIISITPIWK